MSVAASIEAKTINILVVDDSPETLLATEAILGGRGRTIIKLSSGEEALRYLLEKDASVILLDVMMAGLDGYQTASMIRERERTRDLPIIFFTAFRKEESDVAKGYAVGAADYVFKPVVPEILKSKVNCFVALAKCMQALKDALHEKILELERFEELVIGRELKMIELESELKRLRRHQ